MLSQKAKYALKALFALARAPEGELVQAGEIAYSDDDGLMERIRQYVPEAIVLPKPLYGNRLADTINRLEQDKAGPHQPHA